MIDPKNITIDDMDFQLQQLPAMTALKLDKKVIALITPALGGVEKISLDTKIDFKLITRGIGDALSSLDDEAFEKLILSLLSTTVYVSNDGETPPGIIDKIKFDQIFGGKLKTVYRLVFEVMKYNKFLPFELGVGGLEIKKILSSSEKTGKEKPSGKGSGK